MYLMRLILASALLISAMMPAFSADQPAPSAASDNWGINVSLRSSIYLPTPRPVQDVFFVLNESTPDLVFRIEREQADNPDNQGLMAYAASGAIPHDPYKLKPDALGPFPRGEGLGLTLGQWIMASGVGSYVEENGSATLNLTFRNLVPNGTYSVWCHLVTMPPNYGTEDLPFGAPDGSQNVFRADRAGNATYRLQSEPLPPSSNVTYEDYVAMFVTRKAPAVASITWTLISVSYHSDNQTHGPTPGELGKNVHTQLVYLTYPRPARTYEEWKGATAAATAAPTNASANVSTVASTAPSTPAATSQAPPAAAEDQPSEKQPGLGGMGALAVLMAAARLMGRAGRRA